ncbi:hypothetical protein GCM10010919_26040 [Alishewanella longhuensis]|uniref:Cobalamin biosynthesis protein CbiB n=1 Tax=Alishewanella longhuensis TaxID=1091037 RepID=A0ABQ3L0D7_9ALTE|nr:cobalamin biosynthesis protein [Alishewanella longhuensis]GHG73330.1 hypothetical protein GCM10010919_26040 [Alishewanella longhuensis]
MADNFALSVLLLILALLVGRLLPLPLVYHPFSFYAVFCNALALKVHPDVQRPPAQQRLSGVLALILALAIPLTLLACIYLFASWSLLIDAIILIFCANWQPYQMQAVKISQSLQKELTALARVQARLLLLRDTKTLSRMGLVKALLESLCLRFSQQVIATIFWYLLTGAIGLLCYRLCQIASQQWSVKLAKNQYFGIAACRLHQLLCFIPYGLSLSLLYLQSSKQNKAAKRCIEGAPLPKSKQWLLQQLSKTLQVNLGGPAYYQQQQIRRLRLQQQYEPDIGDLKRLLRLQQHQFTLLLLMLASIAGLSFLWQ